MYSNIGGKIKGVAVAGCILGIIASLIIGWPLVSESSSYNPTATTGWVIIIAGSVGSILSSIIIYGFGELIDETSINKMYLTDIKKELTEMNSRFRKEEERRKEEACKEEERKRAEEWQRKKEELLHDESKIDEERGRAEEAVRVEEEQKRTEEPSPTEALFCPQCGKKQPKGVKFCYSCGAKLK